MTKEDKKDEQKLEKLKEWGRKLIPSDFDRFDWGAEVDLTLTVQENQHIIKEKLVALGLYKDQKAIEGYQKAQEAKMIYERNLEALQEVKAYNEGLKAMPSDKRLEEFYRPLIRAVQKLKAGYSRALYIKSSGGLGKTWWVTNLLLQEPRKDFVEIKGDCTPAYLYRLAYENSEKILYFDDTNKILKFADGLNLLKALTELADTRKVMKFSYSKQQDDLPSEFIFKGSVIFNFNYIEPSVKADFEALISRGDYLELAFSPEDVKQIMRLIAKEEWQQEVTEWVIDNYNFSGKNPLNLRTQAKAFQTYQYAIVNGLDWRTEIEAELAANMSRIRGTLYSLIGKQCVKVSALVKLLVMSGEVGAIRTAYTRINEYLLIEELWKVSSEGKDFYVCINPIDKDKPRQEVEQVVPAR